MKKIQNFCFLVTFSFTFIIFSCNKNDATVPPDSSSKIEQKQNEATWISDDVGDAKQRPKWWLRIKIYVGHTRSQCGGKCMRIFGEDVHMNCRGFGDVCDRSIQSILTMDENDKDYILILEKPEELGDFIINPDLPGEVSEYPFPSRALFITNPTTDKEQWLNIPEQTLYREKDGPVTIYGIWFSEKPELKNQ